MNERTESSRQSIPLDGTWEFRLDPDQVGMSEQWYLASNDWPEEASRSITLPHTWQEEDGCSDYTGMAWYRRTITVPENIDPDRQRTFIKFGAADYRTEVWVNGIRVGDNRGGYLPFEVEATDALHEGQNTVVVAVTDPDNLSEIPHGKQGDPWYTRVSGIWQSVTLDFRSQSYIDSVRVIPDMASAGASVTIDVDVGPRDHNDLHALVCAFRNGHRVAADSIDFSVKSEVFLAFDDPDYWTPETPALYDLSIQLEAAGEVVDYYEDYFGMRSIDRKDGQILLNGKPIQIRGVLDQGYYPKTHYRPHEDATAVFRHEITAAKELGFNLIRKHIKPAHPEFLRLADEMGLLVWEEPANPSRYTEQSRQEMNIQLRELIKRDYNRPSVVIWSVYNEEWGIGHHDNEETLWTDEQKQAYLRSVVSTIRDIDPTRLICDNSGWAHVDTDINDYHRYFVSPDRAGQWKDDLTHICHHPLDNYATRNGGDTDAPIMITELGTWALCDLETLREQYSGDPPWFAHEFLTQQMKRPENVDERFAGTDLETVFSDTDQLRKCWQERGFVSIKHLIGQIRKREEIAGFVLTELRDTEWESNGLLDYFHNEKSLYDDFAAVNQDIAVVAEVSSHTVWEGETLDLDIHVVNDTTTPCTGHLVWGTDDMWETSDLDHQTSVVVDPNSVNHCSLQLPMTNTNSITVTHITIELRADSSTTSTTEPITVVPVENNPAPDALVYARGSLASRFAENGLDVTHHLTNTVDIAFVVDISQDTREFLENGGVVVQYPDANVTMGTGPFSYQSLPQGESWDLAASLVYQNSPLLADLCIGNRIGWTFEDVYPHAIAIDLDRTIDTIHAGYLEGWIGNWGSPLVARPIGDGTVIACTFQIRGTYGTHPTMTTLIDRIIDVYPDE